MRKNFTDVKSYHTEYRDGNPHDAFLPLPIEHVHQALNELMPYITGSRITGMERAHMNERPDFFDVAICHQPYGNPLDKIWGFKETDLRFISAGYKKRAKLKEHKFSQLNSSLS